MQDYAKFPRWIIWIEILCVLTLILHFRSKFNAILRNDFALSSQSEAIMSIQCIRSVSLLHLVVL